MRSHVRIPLLALVTCALLAALGSSVAQAAEVPIVERLVASNCTVATCGQENVLGPFNDPKAAVSVKEAEKEGFTQAGGRVPFGVTDFKVLTFSEKNPAEIPGKYPEAIPTSLVTHLRTDVAAGLATNPFAVTQCSLEHFGNKEAVPGSGFYTAPNCPESKIGTNEVTVYAGSTAKDLPLAGAVYNLEPEKGLASEFGVALEIPIPVSKGGLEKGFKEAEEKGAKPGEGGFPGLPEQKFLEEQQYFAHTLIKGNVEWGRQANGKNVGDYHDYFEIDVSPKLPLIRSRLAFEGTNGNGDFITNATSCPGHNTTTLKETDLEGKEAPPKEFTTPIGLSGCGSLPFEPSFSLAAGSSQNDQPDPFSATASEPHNPKANDQSQVKSASFTLPEGMTLNPSAAHGLEACTPKQAHQEGTVFGPQFGVECPAGSKIGTVSLNVPTLPNGSLTGSVYLGGPESGPITGPPYIMYVVANSERFGVSVRLVGEVVPNEVTGQVTTFFRNPPEQPFSSLSLQFERGVLAPVANPLQCGTASGSTSFEPTSAPNTQHVAAFGVPITGCGSSIPFSLGQSVENQTGTAGGKTSFTFNLTRGDGQQYLGKVTTELPAGIVGAIPMVTKCGEPQAAQGSCSSASRIGTATVQAGSGPTPYTFSGPVFMTGPYQGAPFGLSIAVPAVAGPFNLGTVVTRTAISVDQFSGRVVASTTLPTIVKGVPLRLKTISVAVNKQGFLFNPTSCGVLTDNSTLTSTLNATQQLSSNLQLTGCDKLAFKPSFKSASTARFTKQNGLSLETTLNLPSGNANVKSVQVTLPKQLPSRLTTLQKACLEKTFETNPYSCPAGSFVGGVRANTPTLGVKVKGPAILVSHGGRAFPDLNLLLEGEGVRVILVGNTDIKKGVTKTTFASTPDVPVSSITVNLPAGPHSALTGFGDLCAKPLVMPTVITGQNGTVVKQNTKIRVAGCGVRVVGRKVVGSTAYISVQTFSGGRVSASGHFVSSRIRRLRGATGSALIKVPLNGAGRRRHRPFSVRIRVGFVPSNRKLPSSVAFVTVRF
jgi:hypothetical protein